MLYRHSRGFLRPVIWAHLTQVMRLREADFKPLAKQPDWFQGCKLSTHQLEELNGLRERWYHHHNTLMVDESDQVCK